MQESDFCDMESNTSRTFSSASAEGLGKLGVISHGTQGSTHQVPGVLDGLELISQGATNAAPM